MSNTHILVIDDEKDIADIIKFTLQKKGFMVSTAQNGIEALEFLRNNLPDLIVCDVLMPEMGGFEFLQRIKSQERTKQVPIIMLTQKDSFTNVQHAYDMDVSHFLPKPFDADSLIEAIVEILEL